MPHPRLSPTIRTPAVAVLAALLALAAGGCGGDPDFDRAARADTIDAWDGYLRGHPGGAHVREARDRRAALREQRDWQSACDAGRVDAYQGYLRAYPRGAHAHEALIAIANLNLAAAPAAESPAAASAPPAPAAIAPPSPATGGAIHRSTAAASASATGTPDAAPTAASRSDAPSGYRVQLGAFAAGSAAAERGWIELGRRYPMLSDRTPIVAAARAADGRPIHRLQVAGFDREAAEALCAELARRDDPCLVVPPLAGGAAGPASSR